MGLRTGVQQGPLFYDFMCKSFSNFICSNLDKPLGLEQMLASYIYLHHTSGIHTYRPNQYQIISQWKCIIFLTQIKLHNLRFTCFTVWSLRLPPPLGMSSPFHGGAQNFSATPQIHQGVFEHVPWVYLYFYNGNVTWSHSWLWSRMGAQSQAANTTLATIINI